MVPEDVGGYDVIIYLYAEPKKCLERIKKRNRGNEVETLTKEYIELVSEKHDVIYEALHDKETTNIVNEKKFSHFHNTYLALTYHSGLIGLSLFFLLIFKPFFCFLGK